MRTVLLALASMFVLACSDSDGLDASVGPDAAVDAGPDAGSVALACGDDSCNGVVEYCLITPVGPCAARDGGSCGATEESCQVNAIPGCTPARSTDCNPIPSGVANCPGLIASAPCGSGALNVTCSGVAPATTGLTATCPFP